MREWLDGDGGHGNPWLYAAAHTRDTDLTKPTGVWRKLGAVDNVSFSSVAWISSKRMSSAEKVRIPQTSSLGNTRTRIVHPLAAHSAHAGAVGAPGGGFPRSPGAPVLRLPTFPSPRDLESEISALRAEFSARLVIAACPTFGWCWYGT